MASSALANALARRNIHYGWVVVAVTFLTMLVTAGAMGSPGVMIVPLEREFGWENSQISTALALRILLFGVFGPFAAAFMNQYGVRRVVVCALALIAAGFLASLGMTRVWQLVLLWGVVIGFGTGLTAIVLAATVATRWFTQRRGLVVGLLSASSATGQLVFLPLIAELTERFGWRMALVFVCGLLALAALAAAALMRDRPSDLDLPPYGETVVTPPPATSVGLASLLLVPLTALRDAARVPLFWVLFATFFICGASTNGLIQTHFITLCSDYGLTAVSAGGYLGGHLSFGRGVGVDHQAFLEKPSEWVDALDAGSLEEATPTLAEAAGARVLLYRRGTQIYAVSDVCPHAAGPLHEGTVDADLCVTCPWHGSRFRLSDGRAVRGPASAPATVYQARVEHGRVQVRAV